MKPFAILLLLASTVASAQSKQDEALNELLKQVQQSSQQAAKLNAEREARFLRNKNEQAELLARAEAEMAAAQQRVAAVKARYDAHQKSVGELKARLQERAGEYQQVYATVKQAAGDFRAVAAGSLVSAQAPERIELLDRLAEQREVPGVADLEQLWLAIQQEMTESGRVVRFNADILDEEGVRRTAEVVRVGTFTAFTGNSYLALEDTRLVALPRQPRSEYRALAEDFLEETKGAAPIMVDPSRGSLLLLEADRPNLRERIDQGGEIGYIIIAIGVLAFVLAMFQMGYLYVVHRKVARQLMDTHNPRADNPLGRVLRALFEVKSPRPNEDATDAEVLELRLSEAVLREQPKLERFQSFIRLTVAAGPLLGLVGTVGGMIITFQVITEVGAGDPKAMARGISQAMIATLLGLGIAIPLLFINAYLSSRSKALVQILDEQSAGLLARSLEARKSNGA
jgi:biopolymer transport protein ExbB